MASMRGGVRAALVAPVGEASSTGGQARAGYLLTQYLTDNRLTNFWVVKVPIRGPSEHPLYRLVSRIAFFVHYTLVMFRRPDIVHFFSPCTVSGIAEKAVMARVARHFGSRTILNLRNDPRALFNSLSDTTRARMERRICAFDAVLCQFEGLREFYRQLGFSDDRIWVVPNGAEPIDFRVSREEIASRFARRRLIFLGSIIPRKQLEVLIEAVSLLRSMGSQVEAEIVGEVLSAATFDKLRAQINDLHLDDAVRFVGPKFGDEKWQALREATVMVLPSRSEGFSNAILEAMQVGVPCVLSDTGAARDIAAQAGKGAVVVPVGDVNAFVAEIEALLRSEATYTGASLCAQKTSSLYEIESICRRLVPIYLSLATTSAEMTP